MEAPSTKPAIPRWVRILLFGRRPLFTLIRVVVLIVTAYIVFGFVLIPIKVKGPSMLPTFKEGHIGLVSRLAFRRHEPARGDVVSIRFSGRKVMLMKRVIGLPGEVLEFRNGILFINGEPVPEPYVKLPCNWNLGPITIRPDYFYVVGDNRSMPEEDHVKGEVQRERIVGKVLL